jgi:hypothetical protein
MRVLLEKQDHLFELESKLHQYDTAETIQLNLSSRRQDSNEDRRRVLQKIESTLESYGTFEAGIESVHHMHADGNKTSLCSSSAVCFRSHRHRIRIDKVL